MHRDLAGSEQRQVRERSEPGDREVVDEPRLAGVGGGDRDAGASARCGLLRHREHAVQRPDRAVERELARKPPAGERLGRELLRRAEDGRGDRQVEPRTRLAQVGGRQARGDPLERELEAAVDDRGPHPLARLPHRRVRQPDERERGQAAVDVDLDVDRQRVDALEGHGPGAGKHRQNVGADGSRVAHTKCQITREFMPNHPFCARD